MTVFCLELPLAPTLAVFALVVVVVVEAAILTCDVFTCCLWWLGEAVDILYGNLCTRSGCGP